MFDGDRGSADQSICSPDRDREGETLDVDPHPRGIGQSEGDKARTGIDQHGQGHVVDARADRELPGAAADDDDARGVGFADQTSRDWDAGRERRQDASADGGRARSGTRRPRRRPPRSAPSRAWRGRSGPPVAAGPAGQPHEQHQQEEDAEFGKCAGVVGASGASQVPSTINQMAAPVTTSNSNPGIPDRAWRCARPW